MTAESPRSIWFLLIGLLAFVAVSCGGDDSLSEEDFVNQFDDVCLQVSEDLDALDTPETNAELAEQAGEAIDIASQGIEDLSAITPPDDLQDTVDELLGVLEDRVQIFEDLQAAAEDDDSDTIQELSVDNADLESEVDGLGEELGLECFVDETDASDDLTSDFSDGATNDFGDDGTEDLSDDLSSDPGSAAPPAAAIVEYGSDPDLDALAEACYAGDYAGCDTLYSQSSNGSGYQAFGDTCAGRQAQGTGEYCVDAFGG